MALRNMPIATLEYDRIDQKYCSRPFLKMFGIRHQDQNTPYHVLLFVRNGTIYLSDSVREYNLEAGDYLLLRSGIDYHGHRECATGTKGIFFNFYAKLETAKSLDSLMEEYHVYDTLPIVLPYQGHFEDLYFIENKAEEMVEASRQNYFSTVTCDHILQTILHRVSNSFLESQGKQVKISHPEIKRILDEVNKSPGRRLSAADVERITGYSYSHINRRVRESLGMPLKQYVIGQRIKLARELLKEGQLSIEEIAYQTGFCDRYHFSKAFKRIMGLPPGQYIHSRQTHHS